MNEYQDQDVWFGVQRDMDGWWHYESEHDTQEEAEAWMEHCQRLHPGVRFRVKRQFGLGAS